MSVADMLARARAVADTSVHPKWPVLLDVQLMTLAKNAGLLVREVQALCLENGLIPLRYLRNMGTLTPVEQAGLLRCGVVLVGLGGLGGVILEELCRMGVGQIYAADGDIFEEHNANRQLLATKKTMYGLKAGAAVARVRAINSAVEFAAHPFSLSEDSMQKIMAGARRSSTCCVVADALGGLEYRELLARTAAREKLLLVTAGIAGSTGFVAVVPPNGKNPASFFGTGLAAEDFLGSPAPAVFTAASLQCAEILTLLSGKKSALTGKMLTFDLAAMDFEVNTL